ncbi:MAG: hypothetical protein IJN66_00070 [Muribaculaceae bacterium]|nr:hypothetical protein [Muribaculaceae bacterium]
MTKNSSTIGHIACFAAYAIFGFNIIVCKDLTSGNIVSPMALFCIRSIGAGLIFWIISLFIPTEKLRNMTILKSLLHQY